jgi:nucleotide sugar dehydrogenase
MTGDRSMRARGATREIKARLLEKIRDHTALIGVVGLGYVGLPFAVEKARVGFSVTGFEQNAEKARSVNEGANYIPDVEDAMLAELVQEGRLAATTDFGRLAEMDVVVICVPTPLTKNLTPDLTFVEGVTRAIAAHLRPGQLISLESTTYPGTTDEVMRPILEANGLVAEADFFLAHSPERVDPGNLRYTTRNTNKVVGGVGPHSLEVAMAFYAQAIETVVPVSSTQAAELVKVYENTFRAVNIALVNELAMLCDRMGINVWEVLDAAFTKPFGIMPFYPGPGVGGHCIPIDPHYLEWKAKELNFNTHFISLAGEINRKMPEFVLEKAMRALNHIGIAPSRSKVLLLGAGYKRDLGDARESPAIEIMKLLQDVGCTVFYHDPYVPEVHEHGVNLKGIPLSEEILRAQDLVVVATDHSHVDYTWVVTHAKHVLDTRNATKHVTAMREKITLL